jgi:hypothetical protein
MIVPILILVSTELLISFPNRFKLLEELLGRFRATTDLTNSVLERFHLPLTFHNS